MCLRRIVLTMSFVTALVWSSAEQAKGSGQLIYVGTYTGKGSEGIYVYRFAPESGEIRTLGLAARTENPSFLATDPAGRYLYAVNELDTFQGKPAGAVSAFAIGREGGMLKPLQQVSSLGGGPAHLSLDRSGRFLLVANYGGGSVAVFPVHPDGRVGPHTAFIQAYGSSVDPKRQAGPHAHCVLVSADNRRALVADLGLDKLLVYRFDDRAGTLVADDRATHTMAPGSGPRHIAVAPRGKSVYVNNELTSTVAVLTSDAAAGSLELTQTVSTLPAGFTGTNTTAEILLDAQGRSLYVSNRGDDSIVMFRVDPENGRLTMDQRISSGGSSPRHIALDPTGRWLFAANARSNRITLLSVDPETGRMTETGRSIAVTSPVCVILVPVP